MRLILEIVGVAALLYLGWEKPFQHWIHPPPKDIPRSSQSTASLVPPHANPPRANPLPARGGWMWDKKRTTPLDRGAYNSTDNVPRAPQINSSGQPGPFVDQKGNRYWVDQNGVRHYY